MEEASAKVVADKFEFSDPEKLALVMIGNIQRTKALEVELDTYL
jgi:hypothetical protein